jgi:hypothetical protein
LEGLQGVTEKDGIHFTSEGYQNLADRCTVRIKALLENMEKEHGHCTFFWRGYKSTVGAKRIAVQRKQGAQGRGMHHGDRIASHCGRFPPRGFHPY